MREDTMLRFAIAPTAGGAWLWRTVERDGSVRAQGIAPNKKLAAALVVQDIIAARVEQMDQRAAPLSAKAA